MTAALVACIRGGALTGARTGVTFRCPGVTGSILGAAGLHTFTVHLTLSDGNTLHASVPWEVFGNKE